MQDDGNLAIYHCNLGTGRGGEVADAKRNYDSSEDDLSDGSTDSSNRPQQMEIVWESGTDEARILNDRIER